MGLVEMRLTRSRKLDGVLSVEEKFLGYVVPEPNCGCWLWVGAWHKGKVESYGNFWVRGRVKKAHRVSYELFVGSIPSGLLVRHKCDFMPCVNPNHLELGTDKDNMQDAIVRGRRASCSGEANGRAKLTESQVRDIADRMKKKTRHTVTELTKEFGVGRTVIYDIASGRLWAK